MKLQDRKIRFFLSVLVVAGIWLAIVALVWKEPPDITEKNTKQAKVSKQIEKQVKVVAIKEAEAEKARPKAPGKPKPKNGTKKKKKPGNALVSKNEIVPAQKQSPKKSAPKAIRPSEPKKTRAISKSDAADAGSNPTGFKVVKLNDGDAMKGFSLMKGERPAPVVYAGYDRIGFEAYLKTMRSFGGKLYVGDITRGKIVAEAILSEDRGKHRIARIDRTPENLSEMALFRPREITGELLAERVVDVARESFPDSDLRGVILLPAAKEAALLGALASYLSEFEKDIRHFDAVWGDYVFFQSEICLHLVKGRTTAGAAVSLDMMIRL